MISMRFRYAVFSVLFFITLPLIAFADEAEVSGLDGFIEPYIIINIGSGTTGIIDELKVDRGDLVDRGEVLTTLDSRLEIATMNLIRARSELTASLESKKARLEFSVREYERMKDLYNKEIITLGEIDESETNMIIASYDLQESTEQKQIAKLELKQALESVERRIIHSPIKGIVVECFLSIGELVSDQPILQLAQLDPLNVEVIAPVSLFGTIKVGDRAEIRPESPVEGVYTGTVKIVDSVIDAASGTFGIRIQLPNPNYLLPSGLKCRVRFFGLLAYNE